MRRSRRIVIRTAFAALAALSTLTVPVTASAGTSPKPLNDEWWFTAWAVDNEIWPSAQGQGVTVALLDSGVQADLPEFSGAVLRGVDYTGAGGDGRTDTDTAAVAGHGTGMASLIAARGGGTGFVGVAPKAKILPIVANTANETTQGIRYAVDHQAKVINISQGGSAPCTAETQQAIDYANQHDAIIVVASGDYGRSGNASLSPANCTGVLAVGAIDHNANPWPGTERQSYVDIAAPGVGLSAVLKDGKIHTSNGGTSGAAALTSGGIALLRSKFPSESRTEILQRVFASLREVGPSGKDDQTGYGLFRPSYVIKGGVPDSGAYREWVNGHGKVPTKANQPQGEHGSSHSSGGSAVSNLVKYFGPFVLFVILVVVVAFFMRSRQSKRNARNRGPVPPGQSYRPGPQQGPPPSFGPSQNQGPPEGEGRPAFRPPPNQGPPPERR